MEDKAKGYDSNDAIALAFISLSVLIANALLLFTDLTWQNIHSFDYDFEVNYTGFPEFIKTCYSQARFPLWASYLISGVPLVSLYASSLFHPSSLFLLLPKVFALKLNTIVHLELIGIFSYLLFRRLGISRTACVSCSIWNALSGYGLWVSPIISMLNPIPWFLLWMWTVLSFINRPKFIFFIIHTLAISLLLTSGDIQELVYSSYFGSLWLVLLLLFSSKRKWRVFVPLFLSAVLAFILASIQAVPAINLFINSSKGSEVPLAKYTETFISLPELAVGLIGLFTKQFKGFFFCLGTLFFAIIGTRRIKDSPELKASVIVLTIIFSLLSFSRYGLGIIPYHIPLLKAITRHYKLGIIIQPLFLMLSAFGIDYFINRFSGSNKRAFLVGIIALLSIFSSQSKPATIILFCVSILAFSFKSSKKGAGLLIVALACGECFSFLWHPISKLPSWKFSELYYEIAKKARHQYRVSVMYPLFAMMDFNYLKEFPPQAGGVNGEEAFDSWLSWPPFYYGEFLRMLDPVNVAPASRNVNPFNFSAPFKSTDFINKNNRHLVNLVGLRYIFTKDFAIKEADTYPILSDPDYFFKLFSKNPPSPFKRIIVEGPEGERPALEMRASISFDYETRLSSNDFIRFSIQVSGAENSQPVSFFIKASQGKENYERIWYIKSFLPSAKEHFENIALKEFISSVEPLDFSLKFVALFPKEKKNEITLKLIDPQIIRPENTIRKIRGSRVMLLENEEALPRFRILHKSVIARSLNEELEIMRERKRYDPKVMAVVRSPELELLQEDDQKNDDRIKVLSYYDDATRLELNTDSEAILVWVENYYPGWRAWLDGKEVRVYRADLSFRAVKVPAGTQRIEFKFIPLDFRIGLFISISVLFSILLVSFMLFIRPKPLFHHD